MSPAADDFLVRSHPSRLFPGFRAYPPNPSKQIRTWLAHVVPPRRSPAANDFLVRSRPSRLSPAARAHPYNPFNMYPIYNTLYLPPPRPFPSLSDPARHRGHSAPQRHGGRDQAEKDSNSAPGPIFPITARRPVRYPRDDRQDGVPQCTATYLILLPPTMSRRDAEEYIDDGANEMSADEDEAPDDDDEESNAPYSVYIDDRAIEVSGDEDEAPDDDEDSTEAQIRCADERDFQMREIVGTHDQRLRSQEPYRIPPRLLQASGAATPARGDDDDELENAGVRSRSPTPLAMWTAPQQPLSRAATPYVPAAPDTMNSRAPTPTPFTDHRNQTPLFFPDSRGPTPFAYLGPPLSRDTTPSAASTSARPKTPLFLPDSRGPTPYTSHFVANCTLGAPWPAGVARPDTLHAIPVIAFSPTSFSITGTRALPASQTQAR
ncbi:hypothetical protein B0H11DRAFT_1908046 [Mycena galericulata]|nr:hypothetical protein B0H11DRAFT_1908046 [Mycena galericulata]